MLACLAEAFAPYRDHYTPAAYEDTVLTPASAARRMREMTVFVAEDETGGVIGTIACAAAGAGEGHVRGMAVRASWYGRGIAARLLEAAERELVALGCSRATLDTTRPLERAIRFYTRHGYRATGVVRDFFGMPLFEYAKELGT